MDDAATYDRERAEESDSNIEVHLKFIPGRTSKT